VLHDKIAYLTKRANSVLQLQTTIYFNVVKHVQLPDFV